MAQQDRSGRRIKATSAVGKLMRGLLTPAARRRGFVEANVVEDWAGIAGPALASRCQPIRLAFARGRTSGGVLHLRVAGGAAIELMHMAPQIAERINDYYGFDAVRDIKLLQAPIQRRPSRPRPVQQQPLSAADEAGLAEQVDIVADAALQESLLRLGRSIKQRRIG